jgi:hypothetical protein
MWKDYLDRDNERITEWNVRVRHVHERKISSKAIATRNARRFLVQTSH